ncbi:hypothetical protein RJT34_10505 [Clitoria ternatea]|uniref:Uncharacterized protein n=1 Tax=Clitoria ternatea TaxID=43366 RepID=A0AAN9PVP7_CLITE
MASQECGSARVSKAQRKATGNGRAVDKKVADLITSSARKNKSFSSLGNKAGEPIPSTDLNNANECMDNGISNACLENDAVDSVSSDFLLILSKNFRMKTNEKFLLAKK